MNYLIEMKRRALKKHSNKIYSCHKMQFTSYNSTSKWIKILYLNERKFDFKAKFELVGMYQGIFFKR